MFGLCVCFLDFGLWTFLRDLIKLKMTEIADFFPNMSREGTTQCFGLILIFQLHKLNIISAVMKYIIYVCF